MERLTRKQRAEVAEYQRTFPGQVWLLAADRYSATVEVRGARARFVTIDGVLLQETRVVFDEKELNRYVYFTALQAIKAVREGHKEATRRKQREKAEEDRKKSLAEKATGYNRPKQQSLFTQPQRGQFKN